MRLLRTAGGCRTAPRGRGKPSAFPTVSAPSTAVVPLSGDAVDQIVGQIDEAVRAERRHEELRMVERVVEERRELDRGPRDRKRSL